MSATTWTDEDPSEEGLYWLFCRWKDGQHWDGPHVVRLELIEEGGGDEFTPTRVYERIEWLGDDMGAYYKDLDRRYWMGPLEAPSPPEIPGRP